MKKAISLLLALSMAASCATTVFAEGADNSLMISGNGPEGEFAYSIDLGTGELDTFDAATEISTGESAKTSMPEFPEPASPLSDDYINPNTLAEIEALMAAIEAQPATLDTYDAEYAEAVSSTDTFDATYTNDVTGFVTRLYELVLNRKPETAGLNDWVRRLSSREIDGAQCMYGFFASMEYQNRNLSNAQQVTIMYRALFNREADASGFAQWMEWFGVGMTTIGVLNGFIGSTEYANLCRSYSITPGVLRSEQLAMRDRNYGYTSLVYRFYTKCLGRTADIAGLEDWCTRLITGRTDGSGLASGFVFSDEYRNKHTTNTQFVDMLYYTFLDRNPDTAGVIDWVRQLDSGEHSREHVTNGFMRSQEFTTTCRERGMTVSGYLGTPDKSEAWITNYKMLALINGQRVYHGKTTALVFRQDLYEVATARVKELSARFEEIKAQNPKTPIKDLKLDDWRPNNQGDYETVWNKIGVRGAEMYESRVRDTSSADIEKVVTALFKSTQGRAQLLSTTVNTVAIGSLYQDQAKWYAIEVGQL